MSGEQPDAAELEKLLLKTASSAEEPTEKEQAQVRGWGVYCYHFVLILITPTVCYL